MADDHVHPAEPEAAAQGPPPDEYPGKPRRIGPREFLELILPAEGDLYLVTLTGVQGEDGNGKPKLVEIDQRSWRAGGDRGALAAYCARESEAGRDVYVGVHLYREDNSRKKDNAADEVMALWCDTDGAELPDNFPEPNLRVESSPGREHLYWLLEEPIPAEEAAQLSRRIAYGMGADIGKWGLGTVLRVPETRNYKRAEPTPVTARLVREDRYAPEALDAVIPTPEDVLPGSRRSRERHVRAAPSGASPDAAGEPPVRLLPADLEAWRGERTVAGDSGGVDRSRTLHWIGCGIARGLRRAGISEATSYRIVADAVEERDAALGYDKYSSRDDRGERYAEIADEAVAQATLREAPARSGAGSGSPGRGSTGGGALGGGSSTSGANKPYMRTDLGNAERFVDTYHETLMWCTEANRWLVFDGSRWSWDEGAHAAHRQAHESVRSIFAEAQHAADDEEAKAIAAHAVRSQAAARIEALLSQSRAYMDISMDDLDQDIWLVNARNGSLDPRTGELREHRRDDLITKVVDFDYDPDAPAPRFMRFLEQILPDPEVRAFVQRYAGYSLTGSTKERVLAFLHGGGKNGKSTLVEALRAAAGEYAQNTTVETILSSRGGSQIPNDVAALKGARLVSAAEPEKNRRMAESKVKNLTGSDTVTARFMRGEFFDFRPEFKLWISMNHKPIIIGTDDAIWDRIRLVPFNQRFADNPDTELPTKLAEERAGIFAWMVRGAMDWRENGLGCPEAVATATKAYRGEMDVLGGFFDEHCVLHPGATATAAELYKRYEAWCARSGEEKESQTAFGSRLTERGFESIRYTSGTHKDRKGWRGVGLRAEGPEEPGGGPGADSSVAVGGPGADSSSPENGPLSQKSGESRAHGDSKPSPVATTADSCSAGEKGGYAGKMQGEADRADSSEPKNGVEPLGTYSQAVNRTNYPQLSAPSAPGNKNKAESGETNSPNSPSGGSDTVGEVADDTLEGDDIGARLDELIEARRRERVGEEE